MNDELSAIANLMGDPGRAAILLSLMGGVALPAGELAHIANVAPQTASGHLAKLIGGSFPDGERKPSLIGIDCLMCRHAKFRPLASHGTP
jgi:DNA-binding transcriptional ArsR family regulator